MRWHGRRQAIRVACGLDPENAGGLGPEKAGGLGPENVANLAKSSSDAPYSPE